MKHELYNKYNLGLLDPFFEEIFDDTAHRSNFNSIMKTDIKDNDDSYTLEVELPDVKKENINLSLDDGYLTISAKYQSNDNEQNNSEKFIRRERHFGSASRSFYIGENVKEEDTFYETSINCR